MNCIFCDHPKVTGVQYQGTSEDWDGVSEWNCDRCGRRWGRWSKRELVADEIEWRYGLPRATRATRHVAPSPAPQEKA